MRDLLYRRKVNIFFIKTIMFCQKNRLISIFNILACYS
jgi:hypothetical protein